MRILLVDDSALVRGILKQSLEEAGFQIAGQAANGARAVEMAAELNPDLVIMDINMPVMDGLTATRRIMRESPVPILIFSTEIGSKIGFEAVSSGALDVMRKPSVADFNDPVFEAQFREKVSALATGSRPRRGAGEMARSAVGSAPAVRDFRLVVIGASTGGPMAVREVLRGVPRDFPIGIALVQHLEEGFDKGYADWLAEGTSLSIRLAKQGDVLKGGEVLVAPVGSHLRCDGGSMVLDDGPRVLNQKPSVDVLFKTAAASFGAHTLGVLLTGMGRDGAEGCADIVKKGGRTLVQDEATSAIFGMPRSAIELNAASEVLPLSGISSRITFLARVRES